MGDEAEDFDFEGNESMLNLIARMGEIEKAIDDIKEVDKKSTDESKLHPREESSSTDESPSSSAVLVRDVVLDGSDDDDDDFGEEGEDEDAGLADLQEEMKKFDAEQFQSQDNSGSIIAVCNKLSNAPIGISMKTSKGLTKIVAINPNGLLAESELRPDMELVSINGISVKNAKHAKILIDSVTGSITLVAKQLETP